MSPAQDDHTAPLEPEVALWGGLLVTITLAVAGFIALAVATRLEVVPLAAYGLVVILGGFVIVMLARWAQDPRARARRAASDAARKLGEARVEYTRLIAEGKETLARLELERERALDARRLDVEHAVSRRKRAIAEAEAALERWRNPTRGVLVSSLGPVEVYERELVTPDATVSIGGAAADVDTAKPELTLKASGFRTALAIEPAQVLAALELAATVARLAAQEAFRGREQPRMVERLEAYAASLESDRSEIEAAEKRLEETRADREMIDPIESASVQLEAARDDTGAMDAAISRLEQAEGSGARLSAGSVWAEAVDAWRLRTRRIAGATAVLESAVETRGRLIDEASKQVADAEQYRGTAIEAAETALTRWQQPGPGKLEAQLGPVEVYERELVTPEWTAPMAGALAEVDAPNQRLTFATAAGRSFVEIEQDQILEAFELVATISRLAAQEAFRLEQAPRMLGRLQAHRDHLVKDTTQIDAARQRLAAIEADPALLSAIEEAKVDVARQTADRTEVADTIERLDAEAPTSPSKGFVVQLGWASAAAVVVLALAVGGATAVAMSY